VRGVPGGGDPEELLGPDDLGGPAPVHVGDDGEIEVAPSTRSMRFGVGSQTIVTSARGFERAKRARISGR
jgi:hypothetical protein